MNDTAKTIASLHRGELSAVETYRQAIERLGNDPATSDLRTFEQEHSKAAGALADRLRALQVEPSPTSGPWGSWAKITQATANVLGRQAALKSLKEGEEHGLKEYNEALGEKHVDAATRKIIQDELLPRQQVHVQRLDRLLES